ncbi:MAG TPA: PQQ-dependent sugar dehydrogenase [Thermomicrobiales bacterium]|nr:PQQ-dependent sugar dehydrogenase [Thermomicrobiales bacterium]
MMTLIRLVTGVMLLLPMLLVAPVSAQATPVFDPASFDLGLELVADGFAQPLFVTDAGDDSGRLFVVEKGGTIRIIDGDSAVETPFLDLTDRVLSDGYEQGLLGLAFAPDYASSGFFYVDYIDLNGNTVVSRFAVSDDPNLADVASEQVVLTQEQPYSNHNGGMLAFGPDNYLYIGFGDGGSGGDPQGNAQRLDTWLGKILRIGVDPAYVPEGATYGIPEDNPFANEYGALPEIWAYGLRNPWRFSFDVNTGDLWIGDVGQDWLEEVDFLPVGLEPGQNLGWNVTEGTNCYLEDGCDTSGFLMPVLEYTHDEGGCSITGGYVYRGEDVPGLDGVYLFGDYCSGLLWGGGQDANGDWVKSAPIESGFGISSFGEDSAGNVYVTDLNGGGVYVIAPAL